MPSAMTSAVTQASVVRVFIEACLSLEGRPYLKLTEFGRLSYDYNHMAPPGGAAAIGRINRPDPVQQ